MHDDAYTPVDVKSRDQQLLEIQRNLLEVAALGGPINDSLNAIVMAAKQLLGDDCQAAIFITNPVANNLKFVTAVGLHQEYTAAIDNFAIGAEQPSCGRAAFVGHDIIVKDVATDPYWAPYLSLAERYGIRACWSFLLKHPDGKPIGTFAIYHSEPAEPDADDFEVAHFFSNIAALLVARHKDMEDRTQARMLTQQLLESANQNLIQAQAIASHELRNPLQALSMALVLLEHAEANGQPLDKGLQVFRRQLAVMDNLVREMSDASGIILNGARLNKTRVLLQDLIYSVVDAIRPDFVQKQQVLSVNMPSAPIYLEADSSRLIQIFSNLLTNANKYTGEHGRIEISASALAGQVLIQVRDNGIGLDSTHLDSVFDLYSRVLTDSTNAPSGRGIGLNVVSELASLHGGSATVTSDGLGKGSCFSITLPN